MYTWVDLAGVSVVSFLVGFCFGYRICKALIVRGLTQAILNGTISLKISDDNGTVTMNSRGITRDPK